MKSIDPGLRFKTPGGLIVETTGVTKHIDTQGIFVHEVVIVEGPSLGNKSLHNLDYAEPMPGSPE